MFMLLPFYASFRTLEELYDYVVRLYKPDNVPMYSILHMEGDHVLRVSEIDIRGHEFQSRLSRGSQGITENPIEIAKTPKQKLLIANGVNDKEKRLPIHSIPHISEGLSSYEFGTALSGGDCFFDAVSQSLRIHRIALSQKLPDCKRLRVICHKHLQKTPEKWKDVIKKTDGSSFEDCLATLQYTQTEMEELKKQKFFDGLSTWGRPNIEGIMICYELAVKIHVVEIHDTETIAIAHQLITSSGSQSVDETTPSWTDRNTVHIACYHGHFVPITRV